ncbi:MAG: PTS sugar transporter subunit IIA, partial [Planctomycetota bacterium]|jgi:PTS system fructose-specific IIA component|nr:PTS sugar transporter subunit IIA [Planctomycetota bacterium]MDP6938876.1 PTS sugar transporter subunit IIA [Planctomycetota bacterium]
MLLAELFEAQDLLVHFDPADKWEAIQGLVQYLVTTGKLDESQSEAVLEAVLSRERSMSTGMENGIAIPHAAVDELDSVLACMGVVTREAGLAFESIDGQPARFVVLLVIPRAQKLLHIRTLADVARVLSKEDVRGALLGAVDQEAAHQVLVQSGG